MIGEVADRTREQFTVIVERHPPGKPGHAYVATLVAEMRVNALSDIPDKIHELIHLAEKGNP